LIATREHRRAITAHLDAAGFSIHEALEADQLVCLDAAETLEQVLWDGKPDWTRFHRTIDAALERVRPATGADECRAFGELVGLLWRAGEFAAAVELEVFWNQVLAERACRLFCAYPIDIFGEAVPPGQLHALLAVHTHCFSPNAALDVALDNALDEVLGARANAFRQVVAFMTPASDTMGPPAEQVILWLRNMLPDQADEILRRTRQHLRAAGA
jgi:hypothetical protein